MADLNPKFIGDLAINHFENYISAVAGGSANKASTERLIKVAGLEGSSDPFEKMFSALTSHIENFGVTDEMERKLGAIPRNFKNIEDAPYLVQEYLKTVKTGKELRLASTESAAPKTSRLRVSKTPASPVADTLPTGSGAVAELNPTVYQTADELIKDFTTKASSPKADEAGIILKDIFDKTGFVNKQFNIPGSTRSVTGSDVLGKLSGIEMTDQIGSVAAYHPESGRMLVNQNLLGALEPNEIATTFTHELFHTAADASGALDPERLNRATSAGSAMTLEDAKYIGQQEGIADSFSRRTNARSWCYPGN